MADSRLNSKEVNEGHGIRPDSPEVSQLENGKPGLIDNTDEDEEFSYAEQRKIIHRIDRRLLFILGLMYCVSLIDRANMPNAAIAGMHDDLATNIGYRYVSAGSSDESLTEH